MAKRRKTRAYTEEFRQGVIDRMRNGETVSALSKELDISTSLLYGWLYRDNKSTLKKKPKTHVFTDLPLASTTETHLVETAAGGKYMVIICDLTSLKHLAANL